MVNRTGQGSGGVPMMNRQMPVTAATPQAQYTTTSQAARNAGEPALAMAGNLQKISSRLEDRLDIQARDEAAAQGTIVGSQSDVDLRRDGTIRGQAFDAAAARSMMARHDTEARLNAERIYQQYKDAPGALQENLEKYKAGVLSSNLPDELKAEFDLGFDRIMGGYTADAARRAEARQMDEDRATVTAAIDERRKTIERLSFRADNDPKAADMLAKEIESFQSFLTNYGPKGEFSLGGIQHGTNLNRAGIFGASDIQKLVSDTENLTKESRIIGRFMQAKNLTDKKKILTAFETEFWDEKGGVGFDLDQFDRITSRMRGDISRRDADQSGMIRMLNKEISSAQDMVEKGFNPGTDVLRQMEARAIETDDNSILSSVRQVQALSDFQNEIRAMRPDTLQSWINTQNARLNADPEKGVSPFEADRMDLAQKLLTNMNTELARDPLSWAARVGISSGTPLSFTDPASIQQRAKDAATVSAHYGTPMQLMTDEEVGQWKSAWDRGTPDEKVGMMSMLSAGFGSDAVYAFQDMAKESPSLANMGGLLNSSAAHQNIARDYAVGDAALAAGQKVLPSSTKLQGARRDTLGTAYGFAPEAGQAVAETADRIYAARALRKGLGPDDFDRNLYDRALQEASGAWWDKSGVQHGGIAVHKQGHKIVLPANMTVKQFDNMLGNITDRDLTSASVGGGAAVHQNGQILDADDFRRYWLIPSGPGRYLVSTVNPSKRPNPVFVQGTNKDGLYEIDLTRFMRGAE